MPDPTRTPPPAFLRPAPPLLLDAETVAAVLADCEDVIDAAQFIPVRGGVVNLSVVAQLCREWLDLHTAAVSKSTPTTEGSGNAPSPDPSLASSAPAALMDEAD